MKLFGALHGPEAARIKERRGLLPAGPTLPLGHQQYGWGRESITTDTLVLQTHCWAALLRAHLFAGIVVLWQHFHLAQQHWSFVHHLGDLEPLDAFVSDIDATARFPDKVLDLQRGPNG